MGFDADPAAGVTGVDLFSGGGGAALGLRRAGVRCLAHVEWDKHACATLRAAESAGLIDGDVIEGDIRAVDWTPYVGVDLVWASPPCQDWSSAGKRLGAAGERNGWPWTWDAVDKIRPTWLICENVEGILLHSSSGHPDPNRCARCYFDGVVISEARRRFAHVEYRVIDCADLGVPQRRRRVILVCGPRSYTWPQNTHRDPSSWLLPGKPWVTVREALSCTVDGHPATFVTIRQDPEVPMADRIADDTSDRPSPTVSTRGGARGGALMQVVHIKWGARRVHLSQRRRYPADDAPSPPVLSHPGGAGGGDLGTVDATTGRVIRLTHAQRAILQAFPTDWPWRGTKQSIDAQIGNACPPPLVDALAQQLRTP